ncbi:hypothetical protein A3765_23150 [Oleiphilus sp. HI0130]|nr:hypothetical protein A3765_15045 [Oleiphilus sp. HI0130]KZZ77560.1 hypothetical protein A3765_23150 [Oleiphilus sp. HI0130]
MRIGLFIDTDNLGGAETMLLDLASLLAENNQTPVIIHFGNPYIDSFCKKKDIEQKVLGQHRLYKKTLYLPLFALAIRTELKQLQLDCIHSHLFGPIVAMSLACCAARLKHVGTLHDIYMIEDAPKRINLLKIATALGTRLIAVSNNMREFYISHGIKPNQIRVISNFAPEHTASKPRQLMRHELGLNDEDIVVINVARLVQLKRHDLLIQAIPMMAQCESIKVIIAGDGAERAKLEQLIDQLKLTKQCLLLGERLDVPDLLNIADIFALTSDTEGMSRSILEAFQSGLPVIATDVGGNSDLITDQVNGLLVAPGDPHAIALALDTLASDENIREQFGNKNTKLSDEIFNAKVFFNKHLDLYTE